MIVVVDFYRFHDRFHFAKESYMSGSYKYVRLEKGNAACLLVDHQVGLFSLVDDFAPEVFKNNVLALAACAKYFKMPTILTTSMADGPNGPLLPEIVAMHPQAPIVPRPGQINAFDNEDFVNAVKKTNCKQLVIAGIVTDVCVACAALSAKEMGFDVFICTDASGTFKDTDRYAAWMRMQHAGCQLVNWFNVACEMHRDWRNDIAGLAAICSAYVPNYANLITASAARAKK